MKRKVAQNKVFDGGREVRLTVRLTAEDAARLERIRGLMSPYAPLSQGKAVSAALKMVEEKLSKAK